MQVAKQMLRAKARNEAEREMADVVVKVVEIAEKQTRGTVEPEDYAELENEMDEAFIAVVRSAHGIGGVNRYKAALKYPQ